MLLEKLLEEKLKIEKAHYRLLVRQTKLIKQLKEHRGTAFVAEGKVWRVTRDESPVLEIAGELVE